MKLGLCLAGGGSKGIAHIGAIKALQEDGIKFDLIAGTSSGSIIATLYALGYTPEEMYEIFIKYAKKINYFDFKNFFQIIMFFFKTGKIQILGLNSGEKIYRLMKKISKEKNIENIDEIEIPLIIPAVNIWNKELYVFYSKENKNIKIPSNIKYVNHAEISAVVQASCSYPGIFCPCDKIENSLLIDGGIVENIPWREAKRVGVDKVLSIVFSDEVPKKCCNSIFEILNKSFEILCNELIRYEWDGSDYLLKINTDTKGLLNKKNLDKIYQKGYEETKKFIVKNPSLTRKNT